MLTSLPPGLRLMGQEAEERFQERLQQQLLSLESVDSHTQRGWEGEVGVRSHHPVQAQACLPPRLASPLDHVTEGRRGVRLLGSGRLVCGVSCPSLCKAGGSYISGQCAYGHIAPAQHGPMVFLIK